MINELRTKYPKIYNVWRCIKFTKKGKKIGHSKEWNDFITFFNDVKDSYSKGKVFRRIDFTKPYSKDNFVWLDKLELNESISKIRIEYQGKNLTFKQWSNEIQRSEYGIRKRYYSKKNLTTEEILFGIKSKRNTKSPKNGPSDRVKASKMISSYKIKDRKAGLQECDITIDWMLNNITNQPCIYCGDTNRIGCDRINNDVGHLKSNVVPCCYECNCARNRNFTFDEMKELGLTIKEIKQKRLLI